MESERRPDCDEAFKRMEKCMDDYRKDHDDVIALKTKMENLVSSINGLTRTLWGMTVSFLLLGAGFIIWYIQNVGG
jgi:hypothetical protein